MFDETDVDTISVIPQGLDQMVPGPFLAAILSTVDVSMLSGYDRILALRAHQRMASHYQAHVYGDMAAVSDSVSETEVDPEFASEATAAEIRAALRLTRRSADTELAFALDLKQRLPQLWTSLAAGDIDARRARTMVNGTAHLPDDTARRVVEQIIDEATGLTTGQLAARIRRLCLEADPEEAEQRYQCAVADRRIVTEASESGTAHLYGMDLPPHRVAAISRRMNYLAKSLKSSAEARTMDQLRADVYLDLLSGIASKDSKTRGVVDIHVDLETLAGLAETPGELAGYGPVIADIAKQVTEAQADGEWRYTINDPETGRPVHNGTTRRRPTSSQRREVETSTPTCIFPGCRMPATDCDLDHRTPWSQGGATEVANLPPVCRHDHVIRHRAGWAHHPLPGGDHLWISRLGHRYTTSGKPP